MTFFIYGRKSVLTGKGESVENQIEMCRQYIGRRFSEEADRRILIYEDEGFSAKNMDRPQFQIMLRDLRRIRPEYLVCYRLDRISRSVSDFSALIENLNKNGISFICIKEEFDTSKPMGKAMMYIASVFAQLERETIAERVRDNMLMLVRGGRWLGGTPPTGYFSGKTHEILLDGKIKNYCILQEDPAEADIVRKIFAEYLKIPSLTGVCNFLTSCCILARSGKPYTPAVIRQILKNPVYCTADEASFSYFTQKGADVCFGEKDFANGCGLIAYNKRDYKKEHVPRRPVSEWIVAAGKHPGLLPGAQWVSVQQILGEAGGKPHNSYSFLSGILFCGICGAPMYAKARKETFGNPVPFDYICRSKLKGGATACTCRNLNGPATDQIVLESLLQSSGNIQMLQKHLERLLCNRKKAKNMENPYRKEIDQAEKEIDALLLLLQGREKESAFVTHVEHRVNMLEDEISKLKQENHVNSTDEIAAEFRETANRKAREFLNPARYLLRLPLQEQRRLARVFYQKAVWDGNHRLHLYYK